MKALDQVEMKVKNQCQMPEMPLHLHELSLYCDLLANQRPAVRGKRTHLRKRFAQEYNDRACLAS